MLTSSRRIVLLAGLLAAGLAVAAPPPSITGPSVIALKFHADWCGACKAMGPAFSDLANKFDTEPVLFVTLDRTTESGRRQSQYHAAALGLSEVWRSHGGKTGFVLIVDAKTRKVVTTLTKDKSLKEMGKALKSAVRGDDYCSSMSAK